MNQVKPPPIGLIPRWRWLEISYRMPSYARDRFRVQAILDAVFRYRSEGLEPPAAWSREFAEILTRDMLRPGRTR